MELLEREDQLTALAQAWAGSANGRGVVALVTGEPGIGKTALVTRFATDIGRGRVLVGMCDHLSVPRPLGPLRELTGDISEPFRRALAASTAPDEIRARLLDELARPPSPTVLVLEDVHWADDATIDAITTIGRRIAALPAMLVLTFRDGELAADHPLRLALGTFPPGSTHHVQLAPLSRDAVTALAGDAAGQIYVLSLGNPFFVTELIADRQAGLPPSVSAAVAARTAALEPEARRLVELVSVMPARVPTAVLDAVRPGWTTAAEEPERRRLLQVGPHEVRFHHELARTAVLAGLPFATRRRLHAEILSVLLKGDADPAEIVHHADAAGDVDIVARWALVAARRAAAVASNREAYAHYDRAARVADRIEPAEHGRLFEELATTAYLVRRIPAALTAIDRAAAAYEAAGDRTAVGRCARVRSRLHWYAGDGPAARREALAAVDILDPLGESVELARACSALSQLAALARRPDETFAWGRRAAEMAQRMGDPATRAHALVNIGTMRAYLDPDDAAGLEEAFEAAEACGDRHEAARALNNLAWKSLEWIQPAAALAAAERGIRYATLHEVDALTGYLNVTAAWLRLRAGEWDGAARVANEEIAKGSTVVQLVAKWVLAELAVRRGDADAAERLADMAAQADRTGELRRIMPVLELEVEWALTRNGPMPFDRIAQVATLARGVSGPWGSGRLAAWAGLAGVEVEACRPMPAPFAAMLDRDWVAAAGAFGDAGWNYDRALMLSFLDDRNALDDALQTARALGAVPLAERMARRMRDVGMTVPRGQRESTQANPAGLTTRQLEVLRLVAAGLTNVEIAGRLCVSPRTVDHHVAATLAKLGVTTRRAAARRAAELGIRAGMSP